MGKSIILGPVLLVSPSFVLPFFSNVSVEGKFMALKSFSFRRSTEIFWHEHISHHIHLNFRFRFGFGQFAYVLCAHPTSTLDKFKHFLRAIKAVYFMLNILNPRNNTTNCSAFFFLLFTRHCSLISTYIHTRYVRWWDEEILCCSRLGIEHKKYKKKEKLV